MSMLGLGCSIFLKVSAGVALLAFARACGTFTRRISLLGQNLAITFATVPGTLTAGNGPGSPTVMQMREPPAAQPEAEEVIECGNCHEEIKSEPIRQLSDPAKPTEVYRCEHCGSEVMIPL